MTLLDFPQSCPILTGLLLPEMPPKLQPPVKVSNPSVTESSQAQRHTWTPQYPILRLPTFASYPDRASNTPNQFSNKQFPRAPEFCAKMRRPPKAGRIDKRRTSNLLLNRTIRKRISIDKIDPDFVDSSFFEMLRLKRRESNGSTSSTSSDSSSASLVNYSFYSNPAIKIYIYRQLNLNGVYILNNMINHMRHIICPF